MTYCVDQFNTVTASRVRRINFTQGHEGSTGAQCLPRICRKLSSTETAEFSELERQKRVSTMSAWHTRMSQCLGALLCPCVKLMTRMYNSVLSIAFLLTLAGCSRPSQQVLPESSATQALQAIVQDFAEQHKLPGLAAGVWRRGEVVLRMGVGNQAGPGRHPSTARLFSISRRSPSRSSRRR